MVQRAGNAWRKVGGREGIAHDGNQLVEGDVDRSRSLNMRAAAEAVVVILGHRCRVRLGDLLSAAQLGHEQIGRRPRQEQAHDRANHDVMAER